MGTVSWKYNTDGNWSNAADWSGGVLPGATDNVVLDTLSYHTITFSSISAEIASLSAVTDSLAVTSGSLSILGTASFDKNLTASGGTLSLLGATASVGGTLADTAGFTLLGTGTVLTLQGAANFATTNGGNGPELDGAGTLSTLGTTSILPTYAGAYTALYLGGGITWNIAASVSDAGRIAAGDANGLTAAFVNAAGVNFDFTSDSGGIVNGGAQNAQNQTVYGSSTFSNAGTLAKTAGTGTNYVDSAFTNSGVVSVAGGTIEFDGGGSFAGTLTGAGQIAFGGGTATLASNAVISVANLLFDGAAATLDGPLSDTGLVTLASGSLTLDDASNSIASLTQAGSGNSHLYLDGGSLSVGNAYLGAGYIEGAGTITVAGTATLAGFNNDYFYVGGNATLMNAGTVNQDYYTLVDYQSGGGFTIVNQTGATYNIAGDFSLGGNNNDGIGSTFVNAGTFDKSSGSATSNVISVFDSTGTVSAVAGTVLEFDGGGTLGGSLAGAGTIAFGSGSETLAAGLAITASSVLFDGGTVTLAGNTGFSAGEYVEVNGHVLLGGNTLTVALAFLGGGAVDGPGVIATSGSTTFSGNNGGGILYLGGGASVVNTGTIIQQYVLYVDYPTGAGFSVTNAAGAVYDINGNYNIGGDNANGTSSLFTNSGTFEQTSGIGTASVTSTFVNASTGTIAAASGTLEFDGGGSLAGKLTGAGTIAIASNTMTLDAGISVAPAAFMLDGGNIALAANVSLTAIPLTVNGGNSTIALGGFKLTLNNADLGCGYLFGPGTLTTTGTTMLAGFNGDGFTFIDDPDWINKGTIDQNQTVYDDSSAGPTFTNSAGASYDIEGDFGFGYNNNGAPNGFSNAGTFEKAAGTNTSSIYALFNNTGSIDSATGTLEFDGGGTFAGTLTGAGTISVASNTMTLAAGLTDTATDFLLDGGSITLGANLTLTSPFTIDGAPSAMTLDGFKLALNSADIGCGYLIGPGTLTTTGTTSVGGYNGYGFTFIGGPTWINNGTLNQDQTVYDDNSSGPTFTNSAGASYDIEGDFGFGYSNNGAPNGFSNAGTFEKAAGTNTSSIYALFNNTGTIDAATGTLEFDTGGSFGGKLIGPGAVSFQNGATETLSASSISVANVYLGSGTLTLGANETITAGVFSQTGGSLLLNGHNFTVANAGFTSSYMAGGTLATSGTTTLANTNTVTIGGNLSWKNSGTVNQDYYVNVDSAGGAGFSITNLAGAIWNLNDPQNYRFALGNNSYNGVTSSFDNAGTLTKTGGSSYDFVDSVFTNASTGTVSAISGEIAFEGGGVFAGTIVGPGLVSFQNNTYHLGGLSGLAGSAVEFYQSTIDLTASVTLNGSLSTNGSPSDVELGGQTFTLNSLNLPFAGSTIYVDQAGTFSTTGSGSIVDWYNNGIMLSFGGGAIWSNSGSMQLGGVVQLGDSDVVNGSSAGTLVNQAGAVLDLTTDDAAIHQGSYVNGFGTGIASGAVVNNAGLFEKTGGTGTSHIYGTFTSTGTVATTTGALEFDNGGGLSGAIAAGSNIVFAGGSFADGALAVAGGSALLNDTTIDASGALTLGDSNASGFTNAGLYAITANVGIASGSASSTLTNTGTLTKAGGTGRSVVSVAIANTGSIVASSGTLALTGVVSGTGTLDIGAGATLELGAGVAATQAVSFTAATGTLLLDTPASAKETVAGMTVGDAIDFAGITATKATVNSSDVLGLYNGTSLVATLQLAGSYLSDTFTVASDNNGGSLVTLSKATTAWKGTNGDWYSTNVWTNAAPNAQTAATVSQTGAYNVTLNGGETASVSTLALSATQATYNFNGTLNVSQSITMTAGSMAMDGTINGGIFSVSSGASVTFSNGVLNNVAYEGTLDLSENYAYVSVLGSFTIAGAAGHGAGVINLTGYDSTLYADGYETLDNATLNIGSNGTTAALRSNDTNGQGAILTLGTALSLVQTGTYATLSDSGNAFDAVYNDGKITAGFASGTFTVTGNDFENDASIAVSNGDEFSILSAQFVNTGTLTAASATLTINGSLQDVGSITATNSVLDFGTSLAGTELIAIAKGGDTLNLSGTLDGGGGTLAVGAGAKVVALNLSGTIENETINPTGAAFTFLNGAILDNVTYNGTMTVGSGFAVTLDGPLLNATIADSGGGILFGTGAELEKVTYQGTMSLLGGNDVSVLGGLTLTGTGGSGAGAITAAAATTESVLYFLDTETLSNVTISSGTGNGPGTLGLFLAAAVPSGGSLTLAATTTFSVLAGTTAGFFSDNPTSGLPLNNSIVNDGLISLGAGATFLGSDGSLKSFTNAGTVSLGTGATWSPPAGSTLTPSGFINTSAGLLSLGSDAVLFTNGGGMSNAGSIVLAAGAAVTVQGSFAETGKTSVAAGASFTIDGSTTLAAINGISGAGTLGLDGLLNLAGGTFNMGTAGRISNVQIGNGGELENGTFLYNKGTVTFAGVSTLSAMTWEGPLNIGAGATVQIANGLTLETSTGGTPGVVNLSGGGGLDYLATTTLDNMTITSSSPSAGVSSPGLADVLEIGGNGTALTFGPNFVLDANAGALELADTATPAGGALVNNGMIDVTAGALWLDPSFASLTNNATITLADDTEFDPTPGSAGSSSFTNSSTGSVVLTSLDNFDVSGNGVNAGMITMGAGSEITIGGSFTNSGMIGMSHGCSLTVGGALQNTGSIYANGASSDFIEAAPGASSCFNNGTLTSGTWTVSAASTLTLEFGGALTADGADLLLRGSGSVLRSLGTTIARVESTLATITSGGTLSIQQSRGYSTGLALTDNGLLQLQGGTLSAGGLTVSAAATLNGYGDIATAVSNAGTLDALGGTLTLAQAVTGAGLLEISASSELELGTANAETVIFAGASGELRLDAPTSFTGTLSGFASGDSILLASTTATKAVLSGSSLMVTLSGGTTETFHVAGNSSTVTLTVASDGQGDTLITYPAAPVHKHAVPAMSAGDFAVSVAGLHDALGTASPPASLGGQLDSAAGALLPDHMHAAGGVHGLTMIVGREG